MKGREELCPCSHYNPLKYALRHSIKNHQHCQSLIAVPNPPTHQGLYYIIHQMADTFMPIKQLFVCEIAALHQEVITIILNALEMVKKIQTLQCFSLYLT